MIKTEDKQNCCGCGACEQVCPKGCITLKADEEGFLYPTVDKSACVACGLCERVCPILQSGKVAGQDPLCVYAAFAENAQTRETSSSGGIFSLLAEWVLGQNGVVFGAAFTEDFSVHHAKIEEANELYRLRGSKYVQSRTEDTYAETKNMLEQGRLVLFSGVGCQIAGLKYFLGKEYENLFAIDVLCHGVPSPKVWKQYLRGCEEETRSRVVQVYFRNKRSGWHNYETALCFQNGTVCHRIHGEDPYIKMFLSNICLRPSCHSCRFRAGRSGADLTLGDAWGIEKWMPDMDDDRGTSVIFVNSPKGQKLWNAIQIQVNAKCADFETVVKHNMVFRNAVKPHPNRSRFFKALNEGAQIEQLVRLTRKPLWRRVLSFGKKCAKRILGM